MLHNDALSLEYKLMNGRACGHLELADFVNNPMGSGVTWVSGYGLEEQLGDFLLRQGRAFRYDVRNLLLIGLK